MDDLPWDAQAFIDNRILVMSGLRRWSEKWISKYRGTDKIYELRIPHKKVQYRPLGAYGQGFSFILLCGSIEKGDKIPTAIIDTAVRRQRDLENGSGYVREHQFN
jgi:hypothetical protein